MTEDERPVIFGDGTQSRDFTYVSNVVEANILAALKEIDTPVVMNCASNGQVTVNDLVVQINILCKKDIKPIYEKKRPGDIIHSYADINLIENKLGFKTIINFRDGLQKLISSR